MMLNAVNYYLVRVSEKKDRTFTLLTVDFHPRDTVQFFERKLHKDTKCCLVGKQRTTRFLCIALDASF